MPTIDEVFNSEDLLHAQDLPAGRVVPVTIATVEAKRFNDGGKLIIGFAGKRKRLVCNKTNANTIAAEAQTRDFGKWIGLPISLVRATTDFRGEIVECVRVQRSRPPAPQPPAFEPAAPGELQLDRSTSQLDSF